MLKRLDEIVQKENVLIVQAKKSRKLPNLLWALILSIIILISGGIIGNLLFKPIYNLLNSNQNLSAYKDFILIFIQLISCIFTSMVVFFRVSVIEKRKVSSIGFYKNNALKKYIFGFFIGLLMMSSVVLILLALGCIEVGSKTSQPTGASALISILIILIGWIIQGATEEILTRGWLMNVLSAKYNVWIGLLTSSLFFSFLHLLNPSVNYISLINIALVGFFFGLYVIKSGDLWGACAIHTAWNFAQGNIFGLQVSGISVKVGTLIDLNLVGNELITGGEFGPEAGLCATLILVISILVLIYIPKNKFEL